MPRSLLAACLTLLLTAALAAQAAYVPNRVYASARKQFIDFEVLADTLRQADVVFLGEQHDDVNTHRLERALLERLLRRRGEMVLALEMFERDVQEALDHFTMGHTDEADFLADARPWPQYARDYKPLVDLALAHQWPIIAANVPRDIAAAVSKAGLDALKLRPEAEKGWYARDLRCDPDGDYYTRFVAAMGGSAHGGSASPAVDRVSLERYYASQCLKDETMAESIADAYRAGAAGGKRPLVIAVTGSFHSDDGEGTVERTRRRLPGRSVVVVSIVPVPDLDGLAPDGDDRRRAEFLVYTEAPRDVHPTGPRGAGPSAGSSSSAP